MKRKRRVKRMTTATQRKPIRPTQVNFANHVAEQQFIEYVQKNTKTDSVGMNRVREMVKNHKENKR
jgi:hypothetical protein